MHAQERLETFVRTIVADPELHARWLNTFSFLEYVGFRKIVKSQKAENVNGRVLTHAVEEGRHALGLKKLAVRLGGSRFDTYRAETLLCGDDAEAYFQDLDAACDEAFSDHPEALRSKLAYAAVTFLVERRALDVYGAYKNALGPSEIAERLDGLLAEEIEHLADVESWLKESDGAGVIEAKDLEAVEARLYERFVDALSRELSRETPAPAAEVL